MLKIKTFLFNPFQVNTYVVYSNDKEAIIIDPACYNLEEENELSSFISEEKLNVLLSVNTHCHIDHIIGNSFVKSKYKLKIAASKEDEFLLDIMHEESLKFGFSYQEFPAIDLYVKEGDKIKISNLEGKIILTPGHSPGGICILFEEDKLCFTGDSLFNLSVGRTDLWAGDFKALLESIEKKLFSLDADMIIYPGHGEPSSIGFERKNNPFFTK